MVLDLDTIIAAVAALISLIAAVVATWNAKSASKQAKYAQDQADAAKTQAEEAKRSADAAWVQLDQSRHQYRASVIERQHEAFESVLKSSREYARLIENCLKVGGYHHLDEPQQFKILNDLPSADPHYKILWGTLPSSDLRTTLYEVGQRATILMSHAMLLMMMQEEPEPYPRLGETQRAVKEHGDEFHDATRRFSRLGEDFFEAELRRLSEQQWSAHDADTVNSE